MTQVRFILITTALVLVPLGDAVDHHKSVGIKHKVLSILHTCLPSVPAYLYFDLIIFIFTHKCIEECCLHYVSVFIFVLFLLLRIRRR